MTSINTRGEMPLTAENVRHIFNECLQDSDETGNEYYHFAGETNEIAKCVSGLMKADPESVIHILSIVIATGCEILPVEMVQSICSETFLVIGLRQKGMSDDEIRDYIMMIKD